MTQAVGNNARPDRGERRTRVGLIGLGAWARQAYVPILNEIEYAEVVAVAARSAETRQYARGHFGKAALYENYHELLANSDVDAVLVAVPNPIHEEALSDAVASGKHVFYEPPIAYSAGILNGTLHRMSESGRIIQADLELRWLPVVQALRRTLRDGAIGNPMMAGVRLWCNWGYGGGQWGKYHPEVEGFFPWLGCWYLDLLDVVYGEAPLRASVEGGYAANRGLMDYGWASLAYPSGLGRFEFSLVSVGELEITLRVLGKAGEAEADLIRGRLRWRGADATWRASHHPSSEPVCGFVGARECLRGFIDSAHEGKSAEAHVEVARRVHAAMLACAEAKWGQSP